MNPAGHSIGNPFGSELGVEIPSNTDVTEANINDLHNIGAGGDASDISCGPLKQGNLSNSERAYLLEICLQRKLVKSKISDIQVKFRQKFNKHVGKTTI